MRAFLRNKKAVTGLGILIFFAIVAIFAPQLAPHNPTSIEFGPLLHPSGSHLLGTTNEGQDIFSELIYSSRDTLIVALSTGIVISFVQLVMGVFSGYVGGWIDGVLSTITNIFLVLPGLPLLIVIVAYVQNKSVTTIIIVLTITGWAWGARVLRAQAISLRDRPFMEAARMSGEGRVRIVVFHVVPNMFGVLAANFFGAALYAVLTYTVLQYLGLGNINQLTWGSMLYQAQNATAFLLHLWLWLIPPGVCILLLGTGFGLLNFAVDEVADPRLRRNDPVKSSAPKALAATGSAPPVAAGGVLLVTPADELAASQRGNP
jgi:peptide/nickel transport system permease protein